MIQQWTDLIFDHHYLPLIGVLVALGAIFYPLLVHSVAFHVWWKDMRLPRIFHYFTLIGLGLALAKRDHSDVFIDRLIEFWPMLLLTVFTVGFAAVFAIVINNIEDLETDKITNPDRPLVTGKIDQKSYLKTGVIFLILSLLLSFFGTWVMVIGILLITSGYYLYSGRPFRLKKIPILSKLLIGFNSVSMAVMGYALLGFDWKAFPVEYALFVGIPLAMAANFVDLKDTEGDKKAGVKTLPVLLGQQAAKYLIMALTAVTYVCVYFLLEMNWVLALIIPFGLMHIYFVWKEPFNEKPVFLAYLSGLVALDVIIWFFA